MLAFSMSRSVDWVANTWSNTAWPILAFLLGLGALVFVHELGHFLMARWVGIRVETFAIGMGPRVCGIRRGGTDYCLRAIPFGGYVKMTGQEDLGPVKDAGDDQGSFMNKTIGQRFAVVAAGVIMNLLFAALAFVAIGLIGIDVSAPVIGDVLSGYPADEARIVWQDARDGEEDVGLKPGDRILSINGRTTDRFAKISTAALLGRRDQTFQIVFERNVDGKVRLGQAELGLKTGSSPSGEKDSEVLKFGVASAATLELGTIEEDLFADDGFVEGDIVIAVNGQEVQHHWDMVDLTRTLDGSPVPVTVRPAPADDGAAKDDRTVLAIPKLTMAPEDHGLVFLADGTLLRAKTLVDVEDEDAPEDSPAMVRLTLLDGSERDVAEEDVVDAPLLDVAGLACRMVVELVQEGSPAHEAGLLPGDIILSYGRQSLPTFQQFQDVNREFVDVGTEIVVLRDNEVHTLPITPKTKDDRPLAGIKLATDRDHLVVADVRAGSPAHAAGVRSGSIIQAVNEQPVDTWPELINAIAEQDGPIVLSGQNGDGPFHAELAPLSAETFRLDEYRYDLFPIRPFEPLLTEIHYPNPLRALVWGGREAFDYAQIGYASLRAMVTGTVSLKEVRGPLGMGQVAVSVVRHGDPMQFINFMALISVLLAVFNFLPLPVVDGGLAVLLIVEKIRGRPLNARLLNIIQTTGVVLLIGLFALITWRDLWRIINNLLSW